MPSCTRPGQAFLMAFQAGGPHAQDRGLEAVAYAWDEIASRYPRSAQWEKPQGKNDPIRMEKRFRVVPRGIGLVIGCCTFPTWNGYPGLFASLATGNAVMVKPHPAAILPLALTVQIAREVLVDAGLDPNVVTLFAHDGRRRDAQDAGAAAGGAHHRLHRQHREWPRGSRSTPGRRWCTPRRPASTRSSSTARRTSSWSRATSRSRCRSTPGRCARRRRTSTFRATASRPPRDGCRSTRWPRRSRTACSKLLADPARAVEVLGRRAERRRAAAAGGGTLARNGRARHADDHASRSSPGATIRTPLIVKLDSGRPRHLPQRMVRPDRLRDRHRSTDESLAIARDAVRGHGALTLSVYSTSDDVIDTRDRGRRGRGRGIVDQPDRRACSSTSQRPSPTSTAPAPIPPPTQRSPTRRTSPAASAWCSTGCTSRKPCATNRSSTKARRASRASR